MLYFLDVENICSGIFEIYFTLKRMVGLVVYTSHVFLQNLLKIPTVVVKTCFWKLIFVSLHIWNHIFFYILKKSHDRNLKLLSSKNLEKIVKQVMAKLFYKHIPSRPPPPISLKMSFILIRWTPILINCPYKLSKCRIIVLCIEQLSL